MRPRFLLLAVVPSVSQPAAGLPDRWQMHLACSCAPQLPVHSVDGIDSVSRDPKLKSVTE